MDTNLYVDFFVCNVIPDFNLALTFVETQSSLKITSISTPPAEICDNKIMDRGDNNVGYMRVN